ncbi:MAG: hypothetical protein AAB263_01150 [Planctomycetota bacterium]
MNMFIRVLVYGLAALCVLLIVGGVTVLAGLKSRGKISPEIVRDYLLKPEEKAYLVQMKARESEAPVVREQPGLDEGKLLADLAEISGARHANALVEELRRRKASLDERERWIEAREGELRTARSDLVRLARQLEDKREQIVSEENNAKSERSRYAQQQAADKNRAESLNEQEALRYDEIAKLYALQKGDAWQTMRKLEPKEVAKILNAMMGLDMSKNAALLLKLAQNDAEYPTMSVLLHRALMDLKPKEQSAKQVDRMAMLYSFMKPEEILPYLKGMEAKDVAVMLKAITQIKPKTGSDLLAAISKEDAGRGKQVTDLIQPTTAQP